MIKLILEKCNAKTNLAVTCQLRRMSSLKRGMKEFYLAVHPDFFHDFPEEKKVNEQSLKVLHSNVQSVESGLPFTETSLTFFRKSSGSTCDPIRLRLVARTATSTSIYQEILQAFNVPFDKNEILVKEKHGANSIVDHNENLKTMDLGDFQKERKELTLVDWLRKNKSLSQEAKHLSKPYQHKIEETMKIMKQEFGIKNIFHNHKLSYTALNNLTAIFLELLISEKVSTLNNRSLLLSNFTGLDQHGRFAIDPFSPPEIWKQALEELPFTLAIFEDLDGLQKSLSQECFGIRFIKNTRSSSPIPVYFYHKALASMLNGFCRDKEKHDKEGRFKSLMGLIEWDDAFIGTSKEGFLLIPPLTSKKIIFSYASKQEQLIKEKRTQYLKELKKEHKTMSHTKSSLDLQSFFKDPILTTKETISACNKIANMAEALNLQGCDLIISKYYDISKDGVIRIPWNFLE